MRSGMMFKNWLRHVAIQRSYSAARLSDQAWRSRPMLEALEDRTLSFNTTDITINPGSYAGQFDLPFVNDPSRGGLLTVAVVPNLSYLVSVESVGQLYCSVDGLGNITSDNPVAATGSGSTLTF